MAQTGYTPILIYSSSTTTNTPAVGDLTNSTLGSELAINITDGKLFYKDNANAIQVIGWKTVPTTAGGTGLTSYTAGDLLYYASGTTLSKLTIGASGRYLSSTGSAPQWSAPAALTKTDDTNVTLTLGGSASTALLNAASLTLGWTGTLATTRGGTGLSSFTANGIVYASSTSALATGSALTFDGSNLNTTGQIIAQNTIFSNGGFGGQGAYLQRNSTGGGTLGSLLSTGSLTFESNFTERMRVHASGGVSIGNTTDPGNTNLSVTGNVVMATSGNGIDFSATPCTGTSELLADYEEGTWTPAGGSLTNNVTAKYTKVGRFVYANFDISFPGGGAIAQAQVSGMPFTALTPGGGGCIGYTSYAVPITLNIERSNTFFVFSTFGGVSINYSDLNGVRIIGTLIYSV
jgi:hypothetical protein